MIKVRCPVCDRLMESATTADWSDYPFCSGRCRLIDLGRWLGGAYRVPVVEAEEAAEEPPAERLDEQDIP